MTIAITVNAVDSVVLASDSAITQQVRMPDDQEVKINIWNSGNKIFNLRKTWPIAAMMWGHAALSGRSVATLAKELRCRFSGERPGYQDWALDPAAFTIAGVADRVKTFFYDENYQEDPAARELLGFTVAGFPAGSDGPELYSIEMDESGCRGPDRQGQEGQPYLMWSGQPEAISRLASGVSMRLSEALEQLGVAPAEASVAVERIKEKIALPIVYPGMPVGEVIDLADFLVEATIKFVRFTPGHQVVGGPIEIAAITRHEGFKWIRRKHHYPQELNITEALP
jgi:hypothetical protein